MIRVNSVTRKSRKSYLILNSTGNSTFLVLIPVPRFGPVEVSRSNRKIILFREKKNCRKDVAANVIVGGMNYAKYRLEDTNMPPKACREQKMQRQSALCVQREYVCHCHQRAMSLLHHLVSIRLLGQWRSRRWHVLKEGSFSRYQEKPKTRLWSLYGNSQVQQVCQPTPSEELVSAKSANNMTYIKYARVEQISLITSAYAIQRSQLDLMVAASAILHSRSHI